MPPFSDIADLNEDTRIMAIGRAAMVQKKVVAFITDSDPGKADRYIEKLTKQFPGIVIVGRWEGPVANTVTVKVGPPGTEVETF